MLGGIVTAAPLLRESPGTKETCMKENSNLSPAVIVVSGDR